MDSGLLVLKSSVENSFISITKDFFFINSTIASLSVDKLTRRWTDNICHIIHNYYHIIYNYHYFYHYKREFSRQINWKSRAWKLSGFCVCCVGWKPEIGFWLVLEYKLIKEWVSQLCALIKANRSWALFIDLWFSIFYLFIICLFLTFI